MKRIMRFIGNRPEPEKKLFASDEECIALNAAAKAWQVTRPKPKRAKPPRHRFRSPLSKWQRVPRVEKMEVNLTAPLVGWRAWSFDRYADGHLHSINDGVAWPFDEPLRAKCRGDFCRECPTSDHSCGIYARNRREDLNEYLEYEITGLVLGWGRYVRAETGWRAEFAYPAKLILPPERLNLLEPLRKYHVPIYLWEPMRLYDPAEDGYEYWQNEADWNFRASTESAPEEAAGQDQEV